MLSQLIFLQDRLAKAKAEDKKLVLSVQKEERRRRVDKVMKRMKKRKDYLSICFLSLIFSTAPHSK